MGSVCAKAPNVRAHVPELFLERQLGRSTGVVICQRQMRLEGYRTSTGHQRDRISVDAEEKEGDLLLLMASCEDRRDPSRRTQSLLTNFLVAAEGPRKAETNPFPPASAFFSAL